MGDYCTAYISCVADAMARLAVHNALFFGKGKMSLMLIPWVTYIDPQIAHVCLYKQDLISCRIKYDFFGQEMVDVDSAVLDGDTKGFVRILVNKDFGIILG